MHPSPSSPRRSGILWIIVGGVLAAMALAAAVGKFVLELLVLD